MADWYGTSRTNYVRVDVSDEKLAEIMGEWGIAQIRDIDGRYMFYPEYSGDGDWPYYNDEGDKEFSFEESIMPYVSEGEVLVVMTVGAEKLRYITGTAMAYVRRGEEVQSAIIRLNDIYDVAKNKFGDFLNITLCEY